MMRRFTERLVTLLIVVGILRQAITRHRILVVVLLVAAVLLWICC